MMYTPKPGTCSACVHWLARLTADNEWEGECHANPPQILPDEMARFGYHAIWPMTDANDFCGRYESGLPC